MMEHTLQMRERVRIVACMVFLLAVPRGAQAQWVVSDGPEVVLRDPKQVVLGADLKLAPLFGEKKPPRFYLNYGMSGRAGPFELAEQAVVGSAQNPYTLHLGPELGQFTLQARTGDAVLGPFSATNGARITVGATPMVYVALPVGISVVLRHPDRIAQLPKIGLARVTPALIQALYQVRGQMASVAQRVNIDVADREYTEMPRIYNRATGSVFSPVVKISPRDKQDAERGGERTAVTFLDHFFAAYCRIQANAITDRTTYHFWLSEPGEYLLCVMQRIKSPEQGPGFAVMGSSTAIWLTRFVFDGSCEIRYTLDENNAASWRNVFVLE